MGTGFVARNTGTSQDKCAFFAFILCFYTDKLFSHMLRMLKSYLLLPFSKYFIVSSSDFHFAPC
jgi:hypothetical protein